MSRIHWYTAENEKTNDTKVTKNRTYDKSLKIIKLIKNAVRLI